MSEVFQPKEITEQSMDPEHSFAWENLPAYALGALEAEDSVRVEAHVRVCAVCQDEFRAWSDTTSALAFAVPVYEPPTHLRAVIRTLTAGPPQHAPFPVEQRPATHTNPPRFRRNAYAVFTTLLVMMVGLFGWNVRLHHQISSLQAEVVDAHELAEVVMHYMDNPGAFDTHVLKGTEIAQEARAIVMRERHSNRLILVAEGLPALPEGRMYRVWLFDAQGRKIAGGTFRCDGKGRGVVMFEPPVPVSEVVEIGIMPEPASNPGMPVINGKLPADEGIPLFLAAAAL